MSMVQEIGAMQFHNGVDSSLPYNDQLCFCVFCVVFFSVETAVKLVSRLILRLVRLSSRKSQFGHIRAVPRDDATSVWVRVYVLNNSFPQSSQRRATDL